MDKKIGFLKFSEHSEYVWSAYFITFLLLMFLIISIFYKNRKIKQKLLNAEKSTRENN